MQKFILRDTSPLTIDATVTPMFGITSIGRVDAHNQFFDREKTKQKACLARKPQNDEGRVSSAVKFAHEILIYEESSFSLTHV